MSRYPHTNGVVPLRNASNSSVTRSVDAGVPQEFSIKKAFKAFGTINSRRKLVFLRTIFPHGDSTAVKDIASIYDDILAYARPGLYANSVMRGAMKLLAEQISTHQTRHLMLALGRCYPVEAEQFLSALMASCMDDIEESYDTFADVKGKNSKLATTDTLILVPVLDWISQITRNNAMLLQAVLNAGVFDILLRIYIILPALSDSTSDDTNHQLALVGICRFILDAIPQMCQNAGIGYQHPVFTLWTDCQPQPPGYTRRARDGPSSDRAIAWRQAQPSCVKRRLLVIYRRSLWKSQLNSVVDMEACYDILEFVRPQFYDAETVDWAFLAILKHITLSGDSARHLTRILARSFQDNAVYIVSGILRLWLECVTRQVQDGLSSALKTPHSQSSTPLIEIDKSPQDREKDRLFRKVVGVETPLHNVIRFATQLAGESAAMRLGMLEAGCPALVLTAFASAEFTMPSLLHLTKQGRRKPTSGRKESAEPFPLSLAAINAEASTLSVLVRQPRFRAGWEGQKFQTRLALCASLVGALLVEDRRVDDCYGVTRALFRTIIDICA